MRYLALLAVLLTGCATSLKAPSSFVQAGQTPVRCAIEDAPACERAYVAASAIVRRIEGREFGGGIIVVRWLDTGGMYGDADHVGQAEPVRGGWRVTLGQYVRDNLHGYLTHELVHCVRGVLGHDPAYDGAVFGWRYAREQTGQ